MNGGFHIQDDTNNHCVMVNSTCALITDQTG